MKCFTTIVGIDVAKESLVVTISKISRKWKE